MAYKNNYGNHCGYHIFQGSKRGHYNFQKICDFYYKLLIMTNTKNEYIFCFLNPHKYPIAVTFLSCRGKKILIKCLKRNFREKK